MKQKLIKQLTENLSKVVTAYCAGAKSADAVRDALSLIHLVSQTHGLEAVQPSVTNVVNVSGTTEQTAETIQKHFVDMFSKLRGETK